MDMAAVTTMIRKNITMMNDRMNLFNQEKKILKNLDLFVLDNSIRQNSVGSMRAHTVESKCKIYNEVKKSGLKHIAVASFQHETRSGDHFLQYLKKKDEDLTNRFAFVELFDQRHLGQLPQGLLKCQEYGIHNIVLELDLNFRGIDYSDYNARKICHLISHRFQWIRQHLSRNSHILVNIRDFTECMAECPARVLYLVRWLSSLPSDERLFGVCVEDGGRCRGEELGVWVGALREEMKNAGWRGHLLVNIHGQFGMAMAKVLTCLAHGASGIWSGIAEESATMGHASSCLAVVNLAKLGNKKVLLQFRPDRLTQASRNITQITTGRLPHPRTPVVGERALGLGFANQVPTYLGEERVTRISHLSSPLSIVRKLVETFEWNAGFDEEMAAKMILKMKADNKRGDSVDYNSKHGLGLLYHKCGGRLTEDIAAAIQATRDCNLRHQSLTEEIHQIWEVWTNHCDVAEPPRGDRMSINSFYNGFLGRYFGNSRSNDMYRLLENIGLLKKGWVYWNDFYLHIQFVFGEKPEVWNAEHAISIAFQCSIIPYMEDLAIEETKEANKFYKDYLCKRDQFFEAPTGDSLEQDEGNAEDLAQVLRGHENSCDIMVKTSSFNCPSGNASANIKLFGTKGCTGVLNLEDDDDGRKDRVFDKSQRQVFQMESPDVGEITKIRVQLVSEDEAEWVLEWIAIKYQTQYLMFKATGKTLALTKGGNKRHTEVNLFPHSEEAKAISYKVTMKTKNYEGFSADTESEVHITIFGENGNTGKLKFDLVGFNRKKIFDKNSSHSFNFNAVDVGEITNIRLTHSNAEGTCKWLIDFVEVRTNTSNVTFRADHWLKKQAYSNQLFIHLFARQQPSQAKQVVEYEVTIQTGEHASAGTDEKVTINFNGKYGSTGDIVLNRSTLVSSSMTSSQQLFQQQTQNKFLVSVKDVGTIQNISIGHGGEEGGSEAWHLDHVRVYVPSQDYDLSFNANQWLKTGTNVQLFPMIKHNQDNLTTYHVITQTGIVPDASTDANVHVILTGDNGVTEKILLDVRCDYDLFEDGQEDIITVKATNVGRIHGLRVGHDNQGRSANWFLEGVDVINPSANQDVDFVAHCWLGDSVTRRDEVVEKELHHVEGEDGDGEIAYDIEMKTGSYSGAMDGVQVSLCLYGKKTNTGILEVQHPTGSKDNLFDRTKRQLLSLRGPDVGPVQKIRLTHSNPGGKCSWYLDYLVVKTRMLYAKFDVDAWLQKDSHTGGLSVDISQPEEEKSDTTKYHVVLKTGGYHGFTYVTELDPVWICIYGDTGNTGLINWKGPDMDKEEIFDKNNKHYLTFTAQAVGKITCVRVIHMNESGGSEWWVHWLSVKTDEELVKFKSNEWLSNTKCDKRLQKDFFPSIPSDDSLTNYKIQVTTGNVADGGTKSNVQLILHGANGDTGALTLSSPTSGKAPFQQGQTDDFVVSAQDVGAIHKVSISQDNSAPKGDWFVDHLKVEVPDHKQQLNFPVQRWLGINSQDKKSEVQLSPTVKNNPGNRTTYQIHTKTADIPDASTDANVFIILYGQNGDTGKIHLDSLGKDYDLFEQDKEDVFTALTYDVGKINKIRIGHDDQGRSANWYLSWVSVTCPSQRYSDVFHFNGWISSREGGMKIEYDIESSTSKAERQLYDVTLMTSNYRGFGSQYGNLTVELIGESSGTGPLVLETPTDDKDKIFDKNNKVMFSLECADVGDVQKVKIVHDNLEKKCEWKLSWIALKSRGHYVKFPANDWLKQNLTTDKLECELYPKTTEDRIVANEYTITLMTQNHCGMSDGVDDHQVSIALFGDKGYTGMMSIKAPEDDPLRIFDKSNKFTFTMEAQDVGEVTHVRVAHNNKTGRFKWHLSYVNVKNETTGTSTKFTANRWLEQVARESSLKIDLDKPARETQAADIKYEITVKTGDIHQASSETLHPFIIIHGKHGNTEKLELQNGQFEGGREDRFEITAPDVGYIKQISIGHDNTHHSSPWFIESVRVRVPSLHLSLNFQVNCYLNGPNDRKSMVAVHPATDLNPDNELNYHICVKTGNVMGGGTDADVFVLLTGQNGETGVIKLDTEGDYDVFEQGQEDVFTVKAADVGQLKSIRVWHNNEGRSPDWYLQEVTVICPAHGYREQVHCDRWLSTREGQKRTQVTLPVVGYKKQGNLSYEITIMTKNYSGYGTEYGKVSVMLMGEKEDTGQLALEAPPGNKDAFFDKNQKFTCTVEGPDIGELRSIRIRHDNNSRVCKWLIGWVNVKTAYYSHKLPCDTWIEENEKDGMLRADLFPIPTAIQERTQEYDVILQTGNYRGTTGSQSDVTITIYGENGDTGPILLNPADPKDTTWKDRVFDKNNKFHCVLESSDVGPLKSVRIVHENRRKDAEWKLDYVSVKTDVQQVKFRYNEWLLTEKGALYVDIPHPGRGSNDDQACYEVKVKTGAFAGGDTDANVYIIVYGSDGDTDKVWLDMEKCDHPKVFRKNALDTFNFTSVNVGRIHRIRIGHDDSGKNPGWWLNRVMVKSPIHRTPLFFTARRWLTSTQLDRKIDLDLFPITTDNLHNNIVYTIKVKTGELPNASSDALPFIHLYGNNGDTGQVMLKNKETGKDALEDVYNVLAADVGHVHKICLGHDNSGSSPDWFVDEVSVTSSDHKYNLRVSVRQWLRKTDNSEGEGMADDTLYDINVTPENYDDTSRVGTDSIQLFSQISKVGQRNYRTFQRVVEREIIVSRILNGIVHKQTHPTPFKYIWAGE